MQELSIDIEEPSSNGKIGSLYVDTDGDLYVATFGGYCEVGGSGRSYADDDELTLIAPGTVITITVQ